MRYSKAWKESEINRKAAATRASWVKCPKIDHGMSARDYVEHSDQQNNLKPAKYTWVVPASPYGHVEDKLIEVERDEERRAA